MKRGIVFAAVLALCAGCRQIVGPDLSTSPIALFDQVWSDFDQHYSLFVVKQINWDSLGAVYRPIALATTSDDAVSAPISAMLAQLHDDHVVFRGARVGTSVHDTGNDPTNPGVYVVYDGGFADGLYYGTISNTIGYIAIPSFDGTGWLPEVDSALAALPHATSIIIDVRNNGGGFLENATGVAGRFTTQTMTVAYVRYRNGPAHADFTSSIAQQVVPAGPHPFTGNVYLLTGRNTISAAELFVMSMHALGHTTVVGDTTAGETGGPFARELQNGWSYQFPESIEYTLDGREFEGIGLAPDVAIQNAGAAAKKSRDAQLAQAITLAQAAGN